MTARLFAQKAASQLLAMVKRDPTSHQAGAPHPATHLHFHKRLMVWINVLGGSAVLGSYVHGLSTHPATRMDVWGNVPEAIRPAYTVSMLCAAAGYFAFTYLLFFRVDAYTTRIGRRLGFGIVNGLYLGILLPSALWLPLTFAMIENPSGALWWAIRLVLAAVGLASLGLLTSLLLLHPRPRGLAYGLAIAGCVAFCFQTAILDALVWPAFFPL